MKIFCEYCGCRINTDVDTKCPNCGASYRKNKDFVEQDTKDKEAKEKLMKTQEEVRDFVMNRFKSVNKFSKVFLIFPIIIFIVIFSLAISQIVSNRNDSNARAKEQEKYQQKQDKIDNMIDDAIDGLNEEEESVTVGINEFGKTKDYQVKVTGYSKANDIVRKANSGYEYIKFDLIVENLSNKELRHEDVNCIVDGIAQNNYYSSGYSTVPITINKGLTVKGVATFEVPTNAKSFDIKYGDYVTIHIEK